jgi:hypothetical protein
LLKYIGVLIGYKKLPQMVVNILSGGVAIAQPLEVCTK